MFKVARTVSALLLSIALGGGTPLYAKDVSQVSIPTDDSTLLECTGTWDQMFVDGEWKNIGGNTSKFTIRMSKKGLAVVGYIYKYIGDDGAEHTIDKLTVGPTRSTRKYLAVPVGHSIMTLTPPPKPGETVLTTKTQTQHTFPSSGSIQC